MRPTCNCKSAGPASKDKTSEADFPLPGLAKQAKHLLFVQVKLEKPFKFAHWGTCCLPVGPQLLHRQCATASAGMHLFAHRQTPRHSANANGTGTMAALPVLPSGTATGRAQTHLTLTKSLLDVFLPAPDPLVLEAFAAPGQPVLEAWAAPELPLLAASDLFGGGTTMRDSPSSSPLPMPNRS